MRWADAGGGLSGGGELKPSGDEDVICLFLNVNVKIVNILCWT